MILEAALWSLIFVRGDGTYDLREGIKSERVCRETLCYVQWQLSCDDHKKKIEDDTRKAELALIESKKAELVYRVNHPCSVNKDGSKDCPTDICSSTHYDKDGKPAGGTTRCMSTSYITGVYVDRNIKVAACFHAK
jgi:hypothetical protein